MSAADLSPEWDDLAARTGLPFGAGGAYQSDGFADWRGCVALFRDRGFSTVDDLRVYLDKCRGWPGNDGPPKAEPASAQSTVVSATPAYLCGLAWADEMRRIADCYDTTPPGVAYVQRLVAELRESAKSPPDCEEAFRFRLCLVLDWHPRLDIVDLDAAVRRARDRWAARPQWNGTRDHDFPSSPPQPSKPILAAHPEDAR